MCIPTLRKAAGVALVLATCLGVAAVDRASATPGAVDQTVALRARLDLDITGTECDNTGSTITIDGTLSIVGQGVRLTFKNNVQGTHTAQIVDQLTIEVTPLADAITLPKQPARGGVGGNPWISVMLTSGTQTLLSPLVIGRCVQGVVSHVSRYVNLPAAMGLLLTALDCSNKGSSITIGASSDDAGIDAVLLFDNNINRVVHRSRAAAEADVSLLGPRTVRKGGNVNAAGGNPLIYGQFIDDQGAALGSEVFLGRCNKLGA